MAAILRRQCRPDHLLAAVGHEIEQEADFRILQVLVRIERRELEGDRRIIRQDDAQPAGSQIRLQFKTWLVDDAAAAQRPRADAAGVAEARRCEVR